MNRGELARANGARARQALHDVWEKGKRRRRSRGSEILRSMGRVIGSALDPDDVARRATREAARALGADWAALYVQDDHSLRVRAGYRIPRERLKAIRAQASAAPRSRLLKEPRASVWSDGGPNEPALCRDIFRMLPARSIVVAPLQALGELVGVLVCGWWSPRRRFEFHRLRLVEVIAAQAAVALVGARLVVSADAAAVLRERMRMDGILHDMVSQTLFSIGLRLELCLHELGDSALRSKLEAIKRDVTTVMAQVRQMLTYGPASAHAFSARLQRLIDDFQDTTGVPVEFTQHGDIDRLGPSRQEVLQRTFEEGLASLAKHGHSRQVVVRLEVWTDEVQFGLAAVAPSIGARVERLAEPPADWGLDRTFERIKSAGGTIEFWSEPPSAVRLRGTLPLP